MLPVQIRDVPEQVRTFQPPNSDMTRDHVEDWFRVFGDVLDEETQFSDCGVAPDRRQDTVHTFEPLYLDVFSCCIESWSNRLLSRLIQDESVNTEVLQITQELIRAFAHFYPWTRMSQRYMNTLSAPFGHMRNMTSPSG